MPFPGGRSLWSARSGRCGVDLLVSPVLTNALPGVPLVVVSALWSARSGPRALVGPVFVAPRKATKQLPDNGARLAPTVEPFLSRKTA